MSLLSIYSEGTTSTHLAKSLITGFIVAIVDNDPQYEENLAILVKNLDGRVGQAIAIQYLSAIFAADLVYRLDPYYVWRYYQILWWVMRTPWRFIRSVLQNVWWLIQTWRFIVSPWDWQREVVVVNGGSSGIGALIVSQLAEYGIKVVILDAKPPEQTTLLELRNVSFYDIDPTSSENIARAAWWIRGVIGHPTVLINTAGTRSCKPLVEESEDAIRAIFDANTTALLLVKEFLPHMVERNHGHVVTVASFAVQTSSIGSNCTRAATLAFHESLKQELKHRYKAYKVRTTIVHPAQARTPLIEKLMSAFSRKDPILEPATVAKAVISQLIRGESAQLVLPERFSILSPLRGVYNWLQGDGMEEDHLSLLKYECSRMQMHPPCVIG